MSGRSGSHAGRGFHYQDAVGAWLSTRCWSGSLQFGGIVPEGRDDFELLGKDGAIFVQVKSRRDGLGAFSASDVAGFVKSLWDRHDAAQEKPKSLWLVLERAVAKMEFSSDTAVANYTLQPTDIVGKALSSDPRTSNLINLTNLLVVAAPGELAIAEFTQRLGILPLLASVYFREIVAKVGHLSDENGVRSPGKFLSLSNPDFQRHIDTLAGSLNLNDLDLAVRDGLCEAVDFLTPMNDAEFYKGVDVQPGHVVAGLLSERPESRVRVLGALETKRNALIKGQSGAGKSGLLWEAAYTSRHTIRWFRVREAHKEHVQALIRLAESFRASAYAPVGFIVDDAGRGRADLWDALSRVIAARPDILLLATIREEDIFLLGERPLAVELSEEVTESLAQRIWQELCERKQSTWAGWREAWDQSNGLLLEYAHILTSGVRLRELLQQQIDRRRKERRDLELSIIRIVAMAGQAGAAIDTERLRKTLQCTAPDMTLALERLLNEHLVQDIGSGRIGALHQVRASILCELSHVPVPPFPRETMHGSIASVTGPDIENLTAYILSTNPKLENELVLWLNTRLREDRSLSYLAGALRGLDIGRIKVTVNNWIDEIETHKTLARTQITMAALFALTDLSNFAVEKLKPIHAAADKLRGATAHNSRRVLLEGLLEELPKFLVGADLGALTELLASLSGTASPEDLIVAMRDLNLNLDIYDVASITAVLEAANHLSPSLASHWVEKIGQVQLLNRVHRDLPWVSPAKMEVREGVKCVCADYYVVLDSETTKAHERVVALCRTLFALAPEAEVAVCRALDVNGELAGYGGHAIAEKNIPRANLPPEPLPKRNRRWLAAIGERIGARSKTDYLAAARDMLRLLTPALKDVVDGFVRRTANQSALDQLGKVYNKARDLIPPDSAADLGVSDLQHLISHCSSGLIRSLYPLPEDAHRCMIDVRDTIGHLQKVRSERWDLIAENADDLLGLLEQTLENIYLVAGEAGRENKKFWDLYGGIASKTKRGNGLAALASRAQSSIEKQIETAVRKTLEPIEAMNLKAIGLGRSIKEVLGPWPFSEIVILVHVEDWAEWLLLTQTLPEQLRVIAGSGRRLAILPSKGGMVVPSLCMRGVGTLLPLPFEDSDWLKKEGFICVDQQRTNTFGALLTALSTVSGIRGLGFATPERSIVEREAYQNALSSTETSLAQLEALVVDSEIRARIAIFANDVLLNDLPLSQLLWRASRGQETHAAVVESGLLRLALLSEDIVATQTLMDVQTRAGLM